MAQEVDQVLHSLGRPGRFHILVYILLICNYFPIALNHISMAIYGAKTSYSCQLPKGKLLNESAPATVGAGKCSVYVNFSKESNQTTACPQGWVYHTPPKEKNVVMEWDLVCDRSYLVSLSTTIYFIGVMIGGLFFGSLSDYFGRKPLLLICLYAQIIVGTGLFFSKSYVAFVLLRFLQGTLMQGLQTATFVLIMELFTPEHRTAAGTIIAVCWGVGVLWLAGISYAIQQWRYIQLAITLPSLLTIIYIWLVPESLRWLVVHKKYQAAEDMLKKAAKFNQVDLGDDPLGIKGGNDTGDLKSKTDDKSRTKQNNIFDMFTTPSLRKRSFILFYIWFVASTGYYGLTYSITTLAGNKYLNLFIGGLAELPAYCAAVFILKRFGRRKPMTVYLFIGAIFCIIAGSLPRKEVNGVDLALVSTCLTMVGRVGMAGTFSVLFVFTCELYPTVIRNISLATCAFWTRFGGVIAPQILRLDQFFQALPLLIFGGMALLGGFLTLLLPETHHEKLPETMDHVKEGSGKEHEKQCTRL